MVDSYSTAARPRWGNEHRDHKAQAIWSVLHASCGPDVGNGFWLDMGCGSGGIAYGLAPHVQNIVGVDPEPWPAWRELAARTSNLSFRVARCDNATPPADPASIDVVVCNQVYEHVADPSQLIRNIATILKPGGCCYFAGPNLLWPIEPHVFWPFVHWLPRNFAQGLMRALGSKRAEELDAWSFSYWRLVRLFRDNGFSHASAIHQRLNASMAKGATFLPLKSATRVPSAAVVALTPVAPGFVFILRKRASYCVP